MTVTIQRTTYYKHADADVGKRREWKDLDRVINALLSFVNTLQEHRLGDDNLVLILKKSAVDQSQEFITITGRGDDIELLERVVDAGRQLKGAQRDSVINLMVDRDDTPLAHLRWDEREHITTDIFPGALPWQVIAVMYAFRFRRNWEVIARWSDFGRFDDFLTLAVMARTDGKSFEAAEQELAPADSSAKV